MGKLLSDTLAGPDDPLPERNVIFVDPSDLSRLSPGARANWKKLSEERQRQIDEEKAKEGDKEEH